MNPIVCSAIRNRSVVEFDYDGGTRVVEPYCHGTSTRGKELLRGYQVAGYSSSGNSMGWKLFDIAKIVGLAEAGATFAGNRPDYNPDDSAMNPVHCCV